MTLAQARCEAAGEKWTAPRRRTYALLAAAPRPMKAYDLIRDFGVSSGVAKPPTVYRSLDLLMGLGLVHKVASLSAYVVCAADAPHTSTNFLVCDAAMPWKNSPIRARAWSRRMRPVQGTLSTISPLSFAAAACAAADA